MSRKFLVTMSHGTPRAYASPDAFVADAIGHARNRLLHGCEAIAWVGGLSLQWRKRHTPRVSLRGAAVQDATAGPGEQAAHLLAGQILIDGRPPWALASGDAMKVAWLARFMVTSAVPTPFNTADSAAERAGLKEAFRGACERAWSRAAGGERDLTPTFAEFLAAADRAFLAAELGKDARQRSLASGGNAVASDDRVVEAVILRAYRAHGVTAREAAVLFPLVERAA
jgi:hypothetical protein